MNHFVSIVSSHQLSEMEKLAASAPPGAFCEVGVYHGGSAARLYEIAMRQGRELHLFDTFVGTPFFTEGLDKHKVDGEFADMDAPARIRDLLPMADIHMGIYPDTHPKHLGPVAFIHCDCDQYLSYLAVIDKMWPLVVDGGFMLFDDYPYLAGAKKAVEERFALADLQRAGERFYVTKSITTA